MADLAWRGVLILGLLDLAAFAFLAIRWAYRRNRNRHLNWHEFGDLYAGAYGLGFGLWRVWAVRDVGVKTSKVVPSKLLVHWYARRHAADFYEIYTRQQRLREAEEAQRGSV